MKMIPKKQRERMTRVEGFSSNSRVDATFLFQGAQLETLERKLDQSILSPKELESISEQLDLLRDAALSTDSKETYQSLWGRVATLSVNNWVDAIVEESFSLRKGKYATKEELAERVNVLKKEIASVWHNNALSVENRRFIKIAVMNMQRLFPSSKTADMLHHPQIQFSEDVEMLPRTHVMATTVAPNWDEGEIALDLCEMAHFFYQNKFQEGLKKYNQLSPSQRERLEDHCLATGAELITQNRDQANCLRFIQALIGYANELAQGEDIDYYPSLTEVKEMFEEVGSYS